MVQAGILGYSPGPCGGEQEPNQSAYARAVQEIVAQTRGSLSAAAQELLVLCAVVLRAARPPLVFNWLRRTCGQAFSPIGRSYGQALARVRPLGRAVAGGVRELWRTSRWVLGIGALAVMLAAASAWLANDPYAQRSLLADALLNPQHLVWRFFDLSEVGASLFVWFGVPMGLVVLWHWAQGRLKSSPGTAVARYLNLALSTGATPEMALLAVMEGAPTNVRAKLAVALERYRDDVPFGKALAESGLWDRVTAPMLTRARGASEIRQVLSGLLTPKRAVKQPRPVGRRIWDGLLGAIWPWAIAALLFWAASHQ